MKRLNSILFIPLLCFSIWIGGQWNKMTFESATANATTFTESNIPFTITNSNSTFNIKNVNNGGWSGTANDHKYIGNTSNPTTGAKFTLNYEPNIKLKGFYVKLNNITPSTTSGFKIKLVESWLSTATLTINAGKGTSSYNNGYYYIDLTNFGADQTDYSNFTAKSIEFEVFGEYTTLQIDALEWKRGEIKWEGTYGFGSIICHGGTQYSTSVSFSGGVAPYTYTWNTNPIQTGPAQDLTAGTYTVTVVDDTNVTASFTIYISQPDPITFDVVVNNSTCYGANNGTATITNLQGGNSGYDIYWSNGDTGYTANNLGPGTYDVEVFDVFGCYKYYTFTVTEPNALTTTISKTDIKCFGSNTGTATVTPSGGQAPYTYSWTGSTSTSNTASGLGAGTYTVTVKDAANCTTTQTFVISQPASALSATTSQVNATCYNGDTGSASVVVTGGTAPYTYNWTGSSSTSSTASGLTAGSYSVTIKDANNCTITKNFTITQPNQITATTAQTHVSCNGGNNGTATVTASGGTGTLSYSWNTIPVQTTATATGLTAGTYTVTVKDANNCSITKTVTINQPTAITATTTQTNASCGVDNGTATVTASGGTGTLSYSWNTTPVKTTPTVTGLAAGTYTVTIKDANDCSITKTVTITQPTAITATTTQSNVTCYGTANGSATVIAAGGSGNYTYSWNTTPIQTTATASGLSAGTYTVTVSDGINCPTTKLVTITQPMPITATINKVDAKCYGEATGSATVYATGGLGTLNYTWNTIPVQTTSTATGLVAGTYTVTIKDANNCSITKSVTIGQPTQITATTSQINPTCNGSATGSATVIANGGIGTLQYSWNTVPVQTTPTATGLTAGTYTVNIKDANNCSITKTVTIVDPTPITATTSQTDTTCGGNNGTATVTATGGTGVLTYSWNTTPVQTTSTATGLASGTYTVTIKDANNCSITKTVTLNNSTSTAAPTGASTQNYTAGATLANLIVVGQNITWYATAADATNQVNPLPTNTLLVHNTTYYATQTVGGCQSTSSLPVTVIDNALSTSEIEIKSEKTTIYPNPTSSILNVKTKLTVEKVIIYGADGRKVFERKLENNQVNVSSLPSGNYLIQIFSKEKIENLKFIKH